MSDLSDITVSDDLLGVLEWIVLKGGELTVFNTRVVVGTVCGFPFRYFIAEGWIGLKTPDCQPGTSIEYRTFDDFRNGLAYYEQQSSKPTP